MKHSFAYWIFFFIIFAGAVLASILVVGAGYLLYDLIKWIWML